MIPKRKNLLEINPTPGLEASIQVGRTCKAIPNNKAITNVPTKFKYFTLAKSTPNKAHAKVKTAAFQKERVFNICNQITPMHYLLLYILEK